MCVETHAEETARGILQRFHRSCCAVLRPASDPETTGHEIPVGQTQQRERESSKLLGFRSSFVNSIKLDYYRGKAPQILWFLSFTDWVLPVACEVQSSGIPMLWFCRKLSLPPKRKCGHRSLRSHVLECSYETKPNKSGLFTTASSCIGLPTVKMLLCYYQQVFSPK